MSEDWNRLSEKDKTQVTEMFNKNNMGHLLEKYKSMSINEVAESTKDLQKTNSILSIKLNIYRIIIFLGDNNRYNSLFFKENRNDIEKLCVYNHQKNNIGIDVNLFNFKIDPILEKAYLYSFHSFQKIIKNDDTDLLYAEDLEKIYLYLSTYKEPAKPKMNTYLMTDDSGYVKIGKAINIEKRLQNFKTGNPTIKLIAYIEKNIESELHKYFEKERFIGEWFSLSDNDVLDLINGFDFKYYK